MCVLSTSRCIKWVKHQWNWWNKEQVNPPRAAGPQHFDVNSYAYPESRNKQVNPPPPAAGPQHFDVNAYAYPESRNNQMEPYKRQATRTPVPGIILHPPPSTNPYYDGHYLMGDQQLGSYRQPQHQPRNQHQRALFEILFRPDQSFRLSTAPQNRQSTASHNNSQQEMLPSWLLPNAVNSGNETDADRAARYNGPYNIYVNDTRALASQETDAARAARYNGAFNLYVNDNSRR